MKDLKIVPMGRVEEYISPDFHLSLRRVLMSVSGGSLTCYTGARIILTTYDSRKFASLIFTFWWDNGVLFAQIMDPDQRLIRDVVLWGYLIDDPETLFNGMLAASFKFMKHGRLPTYRVVNKWLSSKEKLWKPVSWEGVKETFASIDLWWRMCMRGYVPNPREKVEEMLRNTSHGIEFLELTKWKVKGWECLTSSADGRASAELKNCTYTSKESKVRAVSLCFSFDMNGGKSYHSFVLFELGGEIQVVSHENNFHFHSVSIARPVVEKRVKDCHNFRNFLDQLGLLSLLTTDPGLNDLEEYWEERCLPFLFPGRSYMSEEFDS